MSCRETFSQDRAALKAVQETMEQDKQEQAEEIERLEGLVAEFTVHAAAAEKARDEAVTLAKEFEDKTHAYAIEIATLKERETGRHRRESHR